MLSDPVPHLDPTKPVWLITGCSTGLGRELALHTLALGYRVIATSRSIDDIATLEGKGEALLLPLDVTNHLQIDLAVQAAEAAFGRIDVLVNNAGIGYLAAVEEAESQQIRRMFEVNLFGLSRMIQATLPGMRRQGSGLIINISSIGGIRSFPALGHYNATKFAVEGLSEALSLEVSPLGIKVMVVEPSGFRTDWAGRSAKESQCQIAAYAATAGLARTRIRATSGLQPGDPVRAAHAIVKAANLPTPPHHLLLGNDAYDAAMEKLELLRNEFSPWESLARGADFPSQPTSKPTGTTPTPKPSRTVMIA